MTEKRFTYLNASKNHYIGSFFCNDVPLTNSEVVDLLNDNEQLKSVNMEYEDALGRLEKENKELISIKCFADTHGINIFNIGEAFRRCWNDNGKLEKENERLKQQVEDLEFKLRTIKAYDRTTKKW